MIKVDLYIKVVLTIIALSLCVIAIQNTELIKKAEAFGSGNDVIVTNFETDISAGETLYVHVTNWP